MGVRLTSSESKTALFDSVTGIAFGEIFEDEDEANAFLDFARDDYGDLRVPVVYEAARRAWNEKAAGEWEASQEARNDALQAEWSWENAQAVDEPVPSDIDPDYEAMTADLVPPAQRASHGG